MKTLNYGSEYLRLLRANSTELFAALKQCVAGCYADEGDLAEGVYWFCVNWNSGQWCDLYASHCANPFRPSILSSGPESEVSRDVYAALECVMLEKKNEKVRIKN